MAVSIAPLVDLLQGAREATPLGLAFHHPDTFSAPPPVVGEAQEVELLPLGRSLRFSFALLRFTELYQPGLYRMNR